jgi:hypothetical protein
MDYKCHCGASLQYESREKRWFCPHGHQVYACMQCDAQGKSTPLQWMQQYQRWYCYECKQYAPSSSSTGSLEEISTKVTQAAGEEELGDEEDDDHEEEEGNSEAVGQYAIGIVQGSRIDGFCFSCRNLKFTQNNTRLKCAIGIPRYGEPLIHDVTIRPIGSGKGVSSICGQLSGISGDALHNLTEWLTYFEKQTKRQIRSHEKVANPLEMYRIDILGFNTCEMGADAKLLPVNRDSLLKGVVALIDNTKKKVWVHIPIKEPDQGAAHKLLRSALSVAGSMEDNYSPIFLRDLLKRDIESFSFEKVFLEKESPSFWSVIDKGSVQTTSIPVESAKPRNVIQGPRFEMYRIKFNLGKAQLEANTGERSASETKWISLDPLRTSVEEFDTKKMVLLIDHEAELVWLWVGKKSALVKKFIFMRVASAAARKHQLSIIGSQIGKDISNYDYIAFEEGKEPEQFSQVLAQIKTT